MIFREEYSSYRDRWNRSYRCQLGRFVLAHGLDVVATDPAPNAEENLREYIDERVACAL